MACRVRAVIQAILAERRHFAACYTPGDGCSGCRTAARVRIAAVDELNAFDVAEVWAAVSSLDLEAE